MQGNWGDQPGGGGGGGGGGGFGQQPPAAPPGGGFGPPPGGQPGWGAPPPSDSGGGGGQPQAPIDPIAMASVGVGVLSLILCVCCPGGLLFAIVALGLGGFAMTRANVPGANPSSKSLAIAGLAVGGVSLLLNVVRLIMMFAGLGAGMLDDMTRNM